MKFSNIRSVVEQNNYANKIANAFIDYDLDTRPKKLVRTFRLKNCFFCATHIAKNSNKNKWVYRGYGIAFD